MRLVLFALIVCAIVGIGLHAAADEPPLTDGWYVDEGACPFEGCTYRDWTAEADTLLYAAPWSTQVAGTAATGDTVEGQTGIVYTKPVPIKVAYPTRVEVYKNGLGLIGLDLAPGQTLYLLTNLGEGAFLSWFSGQLLDFEPDATMLTDLPGIGWGVASCRGPSAQCWWLAEPGRQRYESVWWAKIRLPDGTSGWTRELGNFGNIDALG